MSRTQDDHEILIEKGLKLYDAFNYIELSDGTILNAEVHWYEGHGIGKKEIKIKKYF